jgi:hypothetical protein
MKFTGLSFFEEADTCSRHQYLLAVIGGCRRQFFLDTHELGFEMLKNRAVVQFVQLHLAQQPSQLQLAFLQRQPGGLGVRIHGGQAELGFDERKFIYFNTI